MKQAITINHRKYATGLFWQPVNPVMTPYLYARQLVAKSNKKYNLLTEFKSMVGLADFRDGPRAGMYSLAAAVTNAFSEFVSFLAVFQINNVFYLIAVRNGVIIRDVLLDSESEARKLYSELSNMPDWTALIAPTSWGMPRSQEKNLTNVIRKDIGVRLRQISIVKSIMPSVIAICVFLLIVVAIMYMPVFTTSNKQTSLTPEMAAEYQRLLQEKNEELDKKFKIEKKSFEYPYDYLPNVMERARLCYKAIGFMMQPVAGWNQRNVLCGEDRVSGTFIRDFGTLNDFYIVASGLLPGGVVEQKSENEIKVSAKLPALKEGASIDDRDQESVIRDVVSIFQQLNMKADIRVANEVVRSGISRETVDVVEVDASSKLIPTEFMQIFNGFNGVYMKSVDWNMTNRVWNYKVLIYTK